MKINYSLLFLLISIISFAQKSELKKEIEQITHGKNATVAVSIVGIDFPFDYNNENAKKNLPMLSVFKFHISCTALDLVDQGKLKLDQKFLVKKEDLHENTWSPLREKYPNGNIELTLDEIIYYTASKSDNNTTDFLLKIIGGTKVVQNFIDAKKVKPFQIKYDEYQMHQLGWEKLYENYTSTQSMSKLLKDFYKGKILSKSSTDYFYNIMLKTTTGATKLVQQLPPNTVAHRTGSSGVIEGLTIAENDAGIVTLPNRKHYAITVFVIDSKEEENVNTKIVSDISKVVWDYFNKK